MAATAVTNRCAANLHGVLSCWDRIIVTGTLPGACYAPSPCASVFASVRSRCTKPPTRRSNTSTRATSTRKTSWRTCWPRAATSQGCCMCAEYSTDLMFRSELISVPLYDAISRQAVLAADAPRVAGFLGKKITPTLAQGIGSRLSTRIEGRPRC